MYIKDYIQATYDVVSQKEEVDTTLSALKQYLKKRGLTALYPSILRGLAERCERAGKSMKPKIVLARNEDFKKHTEEIQAFLKKIGSAKDYDVKIDENVIGGIIVQNRDKRIDTSYKSTLLHTYRRLTAGDTK